MKFNSQIKICARKESWSSKSWVYSKYSMYKLLYTSGGKIQAWGSGQAPKRGNWPSGSTGLEAKDCWWWLCAPAKTVEEAAAKERTATRSPFMIKERNGLTDSKRGKAPFLYIHWPSFFRTWKESRTKFISPCILTSHCAIIYPRCLAAVWQYMSLESYTKMSYNVYLVIEMESFSFFCLWYMNVYHSHHTKYIYYIKQYVLAYNDCMQIGRRILCSMRSEVVDNNRNKATTAVCTCTGCRLLFQWLTLNLFFL